MNNMITASCDNTESRGFIYVANRKRYVDEAALSARSVRAHHNLPVCLITTPDMQLDDGSFDIVLRCQDIAHYKFESKIYALKMSPFSRTVFLDGDTFICTPVNEMFDVLDIADMACALEANKHTIDLTKFKPRYANVFPEFNTGVIAFRSNRKVRDFADAWLAQCKQLGISIDMPAFRETVLASKEVKVVTLPPEYNLHAIASMLIISGEAKILHERFGQGITNTTPYVEDYDTMERRAKRINRNHVKRLYIHYLGIVPYNWSPWNIVRKLKLLLGAKPPRRSSL